MTLSKKHIYGFLILASISIFDALQPASADDFFAGAKFLQNINSKEEKFSVGSLKGDFQVTPTGQAHYSIPIDVSPGTAGISPVLSIAYDSTSSNLKNGLLGMGFALEGLTAITRCPSNKAQNGYIHGVDFTDKDRFCLNGEQLVAIKGSYGADGTEYRTYIDNKAKIVSYGRQGNGPASFKVWTKGGQVAEYGLTSDSQIKAQSKNSVAIWNLNKIQDTFGNYLEVHYSKDETQGTFYPTEIKYTGNEKAKVAPYNSIKFDYESRPDIKITYQAGSKATLNKRLKTIQVFQETNLVYEYKLNYEMSENTHRSRLISIQKCNGNGMCLPPTKFEWQTNEEGWEEDKDYTPPAEAAFTLITNNYDSVDNGVQFADVNGDGRPDFLWGIEADNNFRSEAWLNDGTKWVRDDTYAPPRFFVKRNKWLSGGDYGVRIVDVNGDGLPDFLWNVSGNYSGSGAWVLSDGTKNICTEKFCRWIPNNAYTPPQQFCAMATNCSSGDYGVRLVDINGDGLPEFLWHVSGHNHYSGAWLNDGVKWIRDDTYAPPLQFSALGHNYESGDIGLYPIDINGDGLPELLWSSAGYTQGSAAWNINLINTDSAKASKWEKNAAYIPPEGVAFVSMNQHYNSKELGVRLVDINGDGLPEILMHAKGGSELKYGIWLNTGAQWIKTYDFKLPSEAPFSLITEESGNIDNGVRFADLNGDGLPDLLWHVDGSNNGSGAWINTGSGWIKNDKYRTEPPFSLVNLKKQNSGDYGVRIIDLNGDGLPDLLWNVHPVDARGNKTSELSCNEYNYDSYGRHRPSGCVSKTLDGGKPTPKAWLNKAKKLPDYLIAVTDGFGEKLTIDYEPLSGKKAGVYTKEHDAKYPNVDWQGPMYVVYQTSSETATTDPKETNDPKSIQHVTTYSYIGAKYNQLGVGFLGFHQIISKDEATGIRTITTYSQDVTLHNKGMPDKSETMLFDGTVISSSINNWELKTFGDGSVNTTYYCPYVKTNTKNSFNLKDGKRLSTTTISTLVDDYGNPKEITSSVADATTGKIHTTTTINTYHNDPEKWFIGELKIAKVTKSATGQPNQVRTSSFEYDPQTSVLTITRAMAEDPELALVTTHDERDLFGNIKSTTVSGKGVETRTSKFEYDKYGRFVVKTTNPLGQSVTQNLDPRFGVVSDNTDANGLKITYQYDDFGRQILQTVPDGTKTKITYSWFNQEPINSHEIKSALKYVAYVITTHTDDSVTQQEYYDMLGRKVAATTQNLDGKVIWQLIYYDKLGRVSQKTLPFFMDANGKADTIYSNTIEYDILGRVVKSILPDGNIAQIIYDGFIITTVNQLGQRRIKTTDALGELIKSRDNLGTVTTYEYDAYGNMIALTDCKGNISKIKYDNLGRKIAIDDPDKGKWTYDYDVLGNLVSQTDAKKQQTTFKYDKLDRMLRRTDDAGTSSWEYDTAANGVGKLARVKNIVDDSGDSINDPILVHAAKCKGLVAYSREFTYDPLSRVAQVKTVIEGKNYTSSYIYDQHSRVDIETYPNSLRVKNSYNDLGFLVKISDADTKKVYWMLNARDAQGHIISESHSNGLITKYKYKPDTGFLSDIDTVLDSSLKIQKSLLPEITGITATHQHFESSPANIQQEHYDYDAVGNVRVHKDFVNGVVDTYNYDDLNRLHIAETSGKKPLLVGYDDLGNIKYKSDVGSNYRYGENGAGPHAVTSIGSKVPRIFTYDANGDQVERSINGEKQKISYTSYSKPLTITSFDQVGQVKASINFQYNADRQEFARIDSTNKKTVTTYYLGNYEDVIINKGGSLVTQAKAYIGPHTIYIKTEDIRDSKNNSTKIYELLQNNLGSVTDITDENGNVEQHFAYTPFGEQSQTKGAVPYHPVTYKGFTGHEEIQEGGINLIHMDGRIYDPVVGRFLSADPFIQDPSNSQSLNRYSYCINNPLAFTDPTGFGFWSSLWGGIKEIGSSAWHGIKSALKNPLVVTAIGIVIGIATSGMSWIAQAAILAGYAGGVTLVNGGSIGDAFFAAGLTFATAGLWHATGDFLGSHLKGGVFDKFIGRTLTHGFVGGGFNVAQGGSFKDGFLAAAVAEAVPINNINIEGSTMATVASRTVMAGVVGGTVAAATGGNFSNGARTAAFAELFNDLAHEVTEALDKVKQNSWCSLRTGDDQVLCKNAKDIAMATSLALTGGGEARTASWLGENKVVLGSFPSYINLAEKMGARAFNVPPEIWRTMSETEQWTANRKFLDRAIARNAEFILSNKFSLDRATPGFKRELEYLVDKGYSPSAGGYNLIKDGG